MVKKTFILSRYFPYSPPSECTLEEELEYWEKYSTGPVTIIHELDPAGPARKTYDEIKVKALPEVDQKTPKIVKALRRFRTFFSSYYLKECFYLIFKRNHKKISFLKSAFFFMHDLYAKKRRLERLLEDEDTEIVIYSYWFHRMAYAAALLKEENNNIKVVTRAHSFDVYEFRRPDNYMRLKRQFKDKLDAVFTLSQEGSDYLNQTYGFSENKLLIRHLGVTMEKKIIPANSPDEIVIISLAVFKPLKRIDKIIKAIALFSEKNKQVKITFHQVGGDVSRKYNSEKEKLEQLAERSFKDKNVSHKFHGTIPHNKVRQFLRNHQIDVLINASETEGVPVSIMEAMANGIPAIAPDVGGVSELVINNENGILLSKAPDITEIFRAVARKDFYKSRKVRQDAREHIKKSFNADTNYHQLIEEITS